MAHRQTGVDTPAFPPDRPAPAAARYHRPGDPWPLYASLEPATVWAEWQAATRGAIDPSRERRRLWRLEVDGLAVADLRRPDVRRHLDVEPGDLVGAREHAQRIADRVRGAGALGMIVPSAARSGGWNLVVFPGGFDRVRTRGSRVRNPAPPGAGGQM